MVVAVDFKDLDGLVGGAGLKELGFVSRAQGGGGGGGGGVDVRRDVCRSSPERSHAGGGQYEWRWSWSWRGNSRSCHRGDSTAASIGGHPIPSAVESKQGQESSAESC